MRSTVAEATADNGGKRFIPVLERAYLTEEHEAVRRDIALALATIDPATREFLEEQYPKETDDLAKLGLLKAMYYVGDRGRITAILEYLSHEDYLCQCNVVNGLKYIGVHQADRAQVLQAVERFIKTEPVPGVIGDAEALVRELKCAEPETETSELAAET